MFWLSSDLWGHIASMLIDRESMSEWRNVLALSGTCQYLLAAVKSVQWCRTHVQREGDKELRLEFRVEFPRPSVRLRLHVSVDDLQEVKEYLVEANAPVDMARFASTHVLERQHSYLVLQNELWFGPRASDGARFLFFEDRRRVISVKCAQAGALRRFLGLPTVSVECGW